MAIRPGKADDRFRRSFSQWSRGKDAVVTAGLKITAAEINRASGQDGAGMVSAVEMLRALKKKAEQDNPSRKPRRWYPKS